MTVIKDLFDPETREKTLKKARKVIYDYIQMVHGKEEVQVRLFVGGVESLVKRGELDPTYLTRLEDGELDPSVIEKEIVEKHPDITEIGYQSLINGFSILSFADQLYGCFHYSDGRDYLADPNEIVEDVESFELFDSGSGDTIETIPVALLLGDNEGNVKAQPL